MAFLEKEHSQFSSNVRPVSSSATKASISVSPELIGLKGNPVQVVKVVDNSFELDEANLLSILNRPDVRNKPVVVVSVAGAFRKGKSFLLNFFIRYLDHICSSKTKLDEGWLDDENCPLAGFAWRGGAERETTGILMWSEPFVVPKADGQEVVVLLMDTQGAFDTESTVKECATIFALSTMISSVQVYNLHANIQENDLQHLQLFTEYGKLAVASGEDNFKPFQSLLFLVRDWSYPYDHEYGIEGGNELLEKRLMLNPSQHAELQLLRQQIRSCFETIDCFLMPHPGLKVATNPRFDGRIADLESDFKTYLRILVPQLLSRDNLIVKEISGNVVTGQDLVEYFRVYMKIFQGDTLPEPKSLMHATAEANNLVALTSAKNLYMERMEAVCGGDRPYLQPEQLTEAHENFRKQAVDAFHSVKKIGGHEFSVTYLEALETDIEHAWENYYKANESKSMLRSMRTPITLFTCFIVLYTSSGVFSAVGLTSFVSLMNALVLITLVLLATWGYCRQTGELREVGTNIDSIAQVIWDFGFFLRQVKCKIMRQPMPIKTLFLRSKPKHKSYKGLAVPIQAISNQGVSAITAYASGGAINLNHAGSSNSTRPAAASGTEGTSVRHRGTHKSPSQTSASKSS